MEWVGVRSRLFVKSLLDFPVNLWVGNWLLGLERGLGWRSEFQIMFGVWRLTQVSKRVSVDGKEECGRDGGGGEPEK